MGDSFLENNIILDYYLTNLKFEISLLYEMKGLSNPNNNKQGYEQYRELQNKTLKNYINLEDINFLNDKIKFINSDYATFKSDGDIVIDADDKLHELYENVMTLQQMQNSCKSNCIGECTSSCSVQCADYCGMNCSYECDGECIGDCNDFCASYCSGTCLGGCITNCITTCHNYLGLEAGEVEPSHPSWNGML